MKILFYGKIIFTALLFFVISNAYSQKIYLNFGLGYNFNAAPGFQITENIDVVSVNGSNSYLSGVNNTLKETISFGEGFQYGGTIGYLFSKNICLELGINYLKGKEYEAKYTERYETYTNTFNQKNRSQMIRFSPMVRFSLGESLRPYLKTGILIGSGSKIIIQEDSHFKDQNYQDVYQVSEYELSGGLSIGFIAGIGLSLEIDKRLGFFSEINIITQSWAPEKLSYTKFNQNGKDVMSFVPKNIKESIFVDSYSNEVPNSNTDSPSKKLQVYLPFSSIGFNIGVFYKL